MTRRHSPLQGLRAPLLLTLLCLGAGVVPSAQGQTFPIILESPVKLISTSSVAGDQYGGAVAAGSDVIVIGAHLAAGTRGQVTVQEFDGVSLVETATLNPLGLSVGAQFGRALTLDGNTLAVGAPDPTFPPNGAGKVYIYLRSGSSFALQATLEPSVAQPGDQFGRSLALQGDRLVVGAPFDDDGGIQAGSAWVFERTGTVWSESALLLASDPSTGAQFGHSVALDGDTILVGAWLESEGATQAGAGYVFVESAGSWSEQAKLVSGAPAAGDTAGDSVAIEGDIAILGAPHAAQDTGMIFQFERDIVGNWSDSGFFPGFSITPGDAFASSLALFDGTLVVGAPFENSSGTAKGTVLFFVLDDQNVFQLDAEIDGLGSVGDGFGAAVSNSGGFLALGTPFATGGDSASGAVFAVAKTTIGIWTDKGKSLDGSKGTPQLVGTGTLVEGEPFSLDLSNSLENALSALFIGFSEICVPFHFGVLSPSPDFVIIGTTDSLGQQQFAGDWPTGHGGPFPVYLQWWIQDPGGIVNWSASNTVEALTPPG